VHGKGPLDWDSFFVNRNDGILERHDLSVDGSYYPLVGNFNGPGNHFSPTEIFWYAPGSAPDFLWQPDNLLTVKSTPVVEEAWLQPARSDYDALVGNFGLDGSSSAEILWYAGGQCHGEVWRGDGQSGFDSYIIEFTTMFDGCLQNQVPLLCDFNGDNRGDIFWYGPGSQKDILWLIPNNLWDLAQYYVVTQVNKTVKGVYRPFVGDFNGDHISDIFWYRSGGASSIWLFNSNGGHSSVSVSVQGDYAPIVGRFNDDSCDDILWYDPINDIVRKWASQCDGTFLDQDHLFVPVDGYPVGYGLAR
jgi:hypothetical protein